MSLSTIFCIRVYMRVYETHVYMQICVYMCIQLVDYDGLHGIVADVMFAFIKTKPQPFRGCLQSKDAFFNGSPWRRAMLFVFLVRHLLGYASQKIWHKFSYKDYKLNYRCFARWMKNDKIIMQKSKHVQDLPDEADVSPAKKRTNRADTTMSSEHSPYKRRCVVDSDTTDDDKCDDE